MLPDVTTRQLKTILTYFYTGHLDIADPVNGGGKGGSGVAAKRDDEGDVANGYGGEDDGIDTFEFCVSLLRACSLWGEEALVNLIVSVVCC